MSDLAALLEQVRNRQELPPPAVRRLIREAAGVTLEAIAQTLEPPVTRSTVHHWESGARHPRPNHLRQYLTILNALRDTT